MKNAVTQNEPRLHGYIPGGRWERILRLIRRQPLTRAEIFDALRTHETVLKVERRKIHFALSELMRRDLIAWTPFGFVATAQGVCELERGGADRLSDCHSSTSFSANPAQAFRAFTSSVSMVSSPVTSREFPTDFETATRSPKERHDFALSTHGRCQVRPTQQEAPA